MAALSAAPCTRILCSRLATSSSTGDNGANARAPYTARSSAATSFTSWLFRRISSASALKDQKNNRSLTIALGVLQATSSSLRDTREDIDNRLSRRHLDLDPAGYYIIWVDRENQEIVAELYCNIVNEKGLACDPETGEVIPCDGSYKPPPAVTRFRGRTAKEISVAIIEKKEPNGQANITMLTHANYLGREFQKAEAALLNDWEYIQD